LLLLVAVASIAVSCVDCCSNSHQQRNEEVDGSAPSGGESYHQRLHDDLTLGLQQFHDDVHSDNLREDKLSYFPKAFRDAMPDFAEFLVSTKPYRPEPTVGMNLACTGCEAGVNLLVKIARKGNFDKIIATLEKLCPLVLDAHVCRGAIKNYSPSLEYILTHSNIVDGGLFCALALGTKCGKWKEIHEWRVDFGNRTNDVKPAYQPPVQPKADAKKGKVLHLSDFHLDLSYQIGSDTDCGLPLCCINGTKMAEDPKRSAGDWGAYKCDLTRWTAEDMIRHIKEEHGQDEFEYIMLTGDAPAHDVWLQSREYNLKTAKVIMDMVKQHFPRSKVVTSLGNHDSFPCNNFVPSSIDVPHLKQSWDYTGLAEIYGDWWLSETARKSFENNGSYHFEFSPGFRMIVVNSNGYIGYNFWLNLDYQDPFGLLPWLYDVLLEAESKGEKVHILSHAPPGDVTSVSGWGANWARVVDRFANTIAAQFYGHTHNDQFIVWYDAETNSVPINVGYVTPSVTTYTGLNPSYRIYTLDGPYPGASMEILDVQTYVFNLTAANLASDVGGDKARPQYYQLYDHRKDLKMANLYPRDFDDLAKRLVKDDNLYKEFNRYFNSDSNGYGYDKDKVICMMLQTSYMDTRKCEEILGHPVNV